jgi:hypothetical protein
MFLLWRRKRFRFDQRPARIVAQALGAADCPMLDRAITHVARFKREAAVRELDVVLLPSDPGFGGPSVSHEAQCSMVFVVGATLHFRENFLKKFRGAQGRVPRILFRERAFKLQICREAILARVADCRSTSGVEFETASPHTAV